LVDDNLEWAEERKNIVMEIIKNKDMKIEDSKIDEMGAWHQEMEVRMLKQIIRKTSDSSE